MTWFKVSATEYINHSGAQLTATSTTVTLTPVGGTAIALDGTYANQAAAEVAMAKIMHETREHVVDPAIL